MTVLLRESLGEFAALRDNTSDRLGVTSGAIEKDYWATEVLRSACSHDHGVDGVVFKGGTSLSKAYHLIERFSEDVDLLVVTSAAGKALKRTLRAIADQVTVDTGVSHEREREGRGYLNARFEYSSMQDAPFLTSGVCSKWDRVADPRRMRSSRSDHSCRKQPRRSTRRRSTRSMT